MPKKRDKNDVDAEVDMHGLTAEEMRLMLQRLWPGWRGMTRVRIVHGRGDILRPELERWCKEMGIPFELEPYNPGSARIYPTRRTLPEVEIRTTLREKGLALTPEEEAYLRDPEATERARKEEWKRRQEEERKRKTDAMARMLERRKDEALWQQEMARLDAMEKKRAGKLDTDAKPGAPIILPPSEIKHQEGYWRAELVRVADTDTDTLKVQKRTGLDKLAPPIPAKPAEPPQPKGRRAPPQRDTEADRALFEAEMDRLADFDRSDR